MASDAARLVSVMSNGTFVLLLCNNDAITKPLNAMPVRQIVVVATTPFTDVMMRSAGSCCTC